MSQLDHILNSGKNKDVLNKMLDEYFSLSSCIILFLLHTKLMFGLEASLMKSQ